MTVVLLPAAEIIAGTQNGKQKCRLQENGFNSTRHPVDRRAHYSKRVPSKTTVLLRLVLEDLYMLPTNLSPFILTGVYLVK